MSCRKKEIKCFEIASINLFRFYELKNQFILVNLWKTSDNGSSSTIFLCHGEASVQPSLFRVHFSKVEN